MARGKEFRAALQTIDALKQSDPAKYWSVSRPSPGYQIHPVGSDGFVGIKNNRSSIDVGALVAKPGARGVTPRAFAVADAAHPEHPQTLDAFDETGRGPKNNLPRLYAQHGFKETGRMKFDPQYAPKEWNEATHGRPDVVMMARPAAQGSLFPDTHPTTPPPSTPRGPTLNPRQFSAPGQQRLPGL